MDRAPNVMRSVAAGAEPVLRPADADIELRYCGTSQVQELLGFLHPNHKWGRSRKEQPMLRSRWLVLLVKETESDGAAAHGIPLARLRRWVRASVLCFLLPPLDFPLPNLLLQVHMDCRLQRGLVPPLLPMG